MDPERFTQGDGWKPWFWLLVLGVVMGVLFGLFLRVAYPSQSEACFTVPVLRIVRVLDGDSFEADIAVWHRLTIRAMVRVLDVDTPEMRGGTPESREAARKAKAFSEAWLAQEPPPMLWSCRNDSFGRTLARVYRDRSVLADELRAAGHGVPYP